MSEPVRFDVEIGGVTRTLVCKPWPYREGRQWLTRMLRLLAPLAESGGDVGIGGLFEQMTDDFMDGLLDACEQHTEIVTRDATGAIQVAAFRDLAPTLAGRYDVTLRLARAHVEMNFGPFFASLGTELAGLGASPRSGSEGRGR